MTPFARQIVVVSTLLAIVCGPIETTSEVSELDFLRGRCVRLRQSVDIIASGNDGVSDVYLSNAKHEPKAIVGSLSAGSSLRILRAVYKKSFEFDEVEIVSEQVGQEVPRTIAISLIFRSEWLEKARKAASSNLSAALHAHDALDPVWAEWTVCQ